MKEIVKQYKELFIMLVMSIIAIVFMLFNIQRVDSESASSTYDGCSVSLDASTNIGKPDLSRPIDLVFIVDASGSMNTNPTGTETWMSTVKQMINNSIDQHVDSSRGDRVMVTSFQGANYSYDRVTGNSVHFGTYNIDTNPSRITSDINEVKNFVNNITANSATPTTQGIYEAIDEYNRTAGDTSNRVTVPILITDGVMTIDPKDNNRVVDSNRLANYWDEVRSISTPSRSDNWYDYYTFSRPTYSVDTDGNLVSTGSTTEQWRKDRNGSRPQALINNRYIDLLHFDTSIPWQERLSEVVEAGEALKQLGTNNNTVMGYLENVNSFTSFDLFGIQYLNSVNDEPAMRPTIIDSYKSIVSAPEYFINTHDQFDFVNQLEKAIESALDETSAIGEFTITEGYSVQEISIVNTVTGDEQQIEFDQDRTTITTSPFMVNGEDDYDLKYSLVPEDDPRQLDGATLPELSGEIHMDGVEDSLTVEPFGPSSQDFRKYLNCQVDLSKVVKSSTSEYNEGPENLNSRKEDFTFKVDYNFYNAPYAWESAPELYDAVDSRMDVKDVYVTDSEGNRLYSLTDNNVNLENNVISVTLPSDENGEFTHYVNETYSLVIEGNIKEEVLNDKEAYQDLVDNGLPNIGELIVDNPENPNEREKYPSNEVVVFPPSVEPSMDVVKEATRVANSENNVYDEVEYREVGDLVYYSFTFENTGDNEITSITFTDEKLGIEDELINLEEKPLQPGDDYTHEVSEPYVVTEADIEAGSIVNTVTATGETPDGDTPPTEDDDEVPPAAQPVMSVEKTATSVADSENNAYDTVEYREVGDLVYYSFTFTNTGNNNITSIKFTDEKLGIADELINLEEPLQPGAEHVHEVSEPYVVTEADIEAGSILNTVRATGDTPDGEAPPTEDDDEVPPVAQPSIKLVKTATEVNGSKDVIVHSAGDVITYEFKITNTGDTPLVNITLDDKLLDNAVEVPTGTVLAVGESLTFEATRTVTEDDIKNLNENGNIPNVASVTGEKEDPDNPGEPDENTPPVTSEDDEEVPHETPPTEEDDEVPPAAQPSINLVKTATKVNGSEDVIVRSVGDVITYEFEITNTGNTPLVNIVLEDKLLDEVVEVPAGTVLAVGDSLTLKGTRTVTDNDIVNLNENGNIPNVASVTGEKEDSDNPGDPEKNTPPVTSEDNEEVPHETPETPETPENPVEEGEPSKTVSRLDGSEEGTLLEVLLTEQFVFNISTDIKTDSNLTYFSIMDELESELNIDKVDVVYAKNNDGQDNGDTADNDELIESLQLEIEELEKLIAELSSEDNTKSKLDELNEQIENKDAEIKDLYSKLDDETSNDESTAQLQSLKERKELLTNDITELKSKEEEVLEESTAQEETVTDYSEEILQKQSELNDIETNITELENTLAAESQMENIELDKAIEKLQKEKEMLESEKEHLATQNDDDISRLEQKLREKQEQLNDLNDEASQEETLEIMDGSILEYGNLEISNQKVIFEITDESVLKALENGTITMHITSSIVEEADLTKYEDGSIPNTATVTFNNDGKTTNKVVVIPKVPEEETPGEDSEDEGREEETPDEGPEEETPDEDPEKTPEDNPKKDTPKEKDSPSEEDDEGETLPSTATNTWIIGLVGLILLVAGVGLKYSQKRSS